MRFKIFISLSLVIAFALAIPSVASAKPASFDACTGDTVTGVVVVVDGTTGEITLYTADGTECTVVKRVEDYDHPVINLLGQFFEEVSLEELSENLENLQAWVIFNPITTSYEFANETDIGAVSAIVIDVTDNLDGTYQIMLLVEGETLPQAITTSDSNLYQSYLDSLLLDTVTFDLIMDGTGSTFVNDGADQIGAYHDDGMGLGVLVKLFAMADAYGVPVDELVTRFKDGEGIGQLFKDENLGKPDLLGVGHVFKDLGKNPGHPDGKNNPSSSNKSDNPGKGNKDNPGKGNKD
jgi:hypothetical protein